MTCIFIDKIFLLVIFDPNSYKYFKHFDQQIYNVKKIVIVTLNVKSLINNVILSFCLNFKEREITPRSYQLLDLIKVKLIMKKRRE